MSVIRVFIAASPGHPITVAAVDALRSDARVEIVGVSGGQVRREALRSSRADLLVSAAHRYLIPDSVLALPTLGAVGLHPSTLPRGRGSYPLWWSLRRGERETALSLFHLQKEVDGGPIIFQRPVTILPVDTFGTLYTRVAAEVCPALDALITAIERTGAIPAGVAQDSAAVTFVTTPPLRWRVAMRLYWALRRRTLAVSGDLQLTTDTITGR